MPVEPTAKPADPKYVLTTNGNFGPFPPVNEHGQPTVFTKSQFKRMPAHKAPPLDDEGGGQTPDQYHDMLLARGVTLGLIALVAPAPVLADREPDLVPTGPENKPAAVVKATTPAPVVNKGA